MTEFFYKVLYRGLLACSAILTLIISLVVYRKMWLAGNSLSEMGAEGNVLIFMMVLVLGSLVLCWRISKALKNL